MLAAVCNGVNCQVLLSTFYLSLFFGDWHCRNVVFCIWRLGIVGWLIAEIFCGCWLNHGEGQIRSVWVLGLLLVASLMLFCCSLFYFCLLDAHMTTQALNEHTISLSRLNCLHFLWKICSCVVCQLYILVLHPLYIFV